MELNLSNLKPSTLTSIIKDLLEQANDMHASLSDKIENSEYETIKNNISLIDNDISELFDALKSNVGTIEALLLIQS